MYFLGMKVNTKKLLKNFNQIFVWMECMYYILFFSLSSRKGSKEQNRKDNNVDEILHIVLYHPLCDKNVQLLII